MKYTELAQKVDRDKNTHTNWRKRRTLPNISDLEEIAEALRVSPADLLRPSEGSRTPRISEQMQLPFEPGSNDVKIEVQYTPVGLILRPLQKSAA